MLIYALVTKYALLHLAKAKLPVPKVTKLSHDAKFMHPCSETEGFGGHQHHRGERADKHVHRALTRLSGNTAYLGAVSYTLQNAIE